MSDLPAKWKPRASALGYYMDCTYRAAFDRALHEGSIDLPPDVLAAINANKESSPYADLGTVIHWYTQVELGAQFPSTKEDHAPSEDQMLNAARLFGSDRERLMSAVTAAKRLLTAAIQGKFPGVEWHAEMYIKRRWVSGHIDLVSKDFTILCDIKTTSRPPDWANVPTEHVVQTLAYVRAMEEKYRTTFEQVVLAYVDSKAASWYCLSEYDPRTPAMQEMGEFTRQRIKQLTSAKYMQLAVPNAGPHCGSKFCPYTPICRDYYAAPKGNVVKPDPVGKVTSVNPFAKG